MSPFSSLPHHPVVTVESVTYTKYGRFADVRFKPVRLPYAYFGQVQSSAPLIGAVRMPARHLHDQVLAGDQVILFVNHDYRPRLALLRHTTSAASACN